MAETERLAGALAAAAADTRPAPIVLMHLLMAAGDEPGLYEALALAASAAPAAGQGPSARLAALRDLLDRLPEAPALVRAVMAEADHGRGPREGEDPVAHWTAVFDRLAALSPVAGAALYSFGDAGLMDRATAEIVDWLAVAGLLGCDRVVLDFGCGPGRVAAALAPHCGFVVGTDVSEGMLQAGRGAVPLVRGSGRDLAAFADARFDLVVACDVFPYLVQAGGGLAARHVGEIARVLRDGGEAVAFNLSYRGDAALDGADAQDWADAAGLVLVAVGERPLSLWDGWPVRWRKPPA